LSFQYFTSIFEILINNCKNFSASISNKENRRNIKLILSNMAVFESKINSLINNYYLFKYRTQGFSKDVSQYFHGSYNIDQLINLCSSYKLELNEKHTITHNFESRRMSKVIERLLVFFASIGVFDLIISLYWFNSSSDYKRVNSFQIIRSFLESIPLELTLLLPFLVVFSIIILSIFKSDPK
jgi:hypothetical protein